MNRRGKHISYMVESYIPSHEQKRETCIKYGGILYMYHHMNRYGNMYIVQYHEMVESTILSMSRSGKHVSYCTVYDGIGIP